MTKIKISLELSVKQVREIDRYAEWAGLSREDAVRRLSHEGMPVRMLDSVWGKKKARK